MPKLKRTPADDWFSKCVRERANWTCEICNTHYPDAAANGAGQLDCSHHEGRGNWSVRFDPDNAECACCACHFREGGTERRAREALGDGRYEILMEKARDTELGRMYRRTKGKGDISKHFRNEFRRMRKLRAEGVTGRIEFEAYY